MRAPSPPGIPCEDVAPNAILLAPEPPTRPKRCSLACDPLAHDTCLAIYSSRAMNSCTPLPCSINGPPPGANRPVAQFLVSEACRWRSLRNKSNSALCSHQSSSQEPCTNPTADMARPIMTHLTLHCLASPPVGNPVNNNDGAVGTREEVCIPTHVTTRIIVQLAS